MLDAYIGLPSLTAAQQAVNRLRSSRIPARVVRMPALANVRCAFGVKVPDRRAAEALAILQALFPGRELRLFYDRRGRPDQP